MAEKSSDSGGRSFVDEIVSDPNNVPDVMLLHGYPGGSSVEGHERLYLNPDLSNYVEVPADAILHRMAAADPNPTGYETLWVRKDAALTYRMAPAAEALAHYFAGAIQAQAGTPVGLAPAQMANQRAFTPALTVGGPACGVTLPNVCQIATAFCTQNTCGAACTVAGPCMSQAPDCQTQVATCACTDFGCRTDVTPCINTHVVTCGACPSELAVCGTAVGCQTAGADCTFIGCGHTLACTNGLLCRAAGPVQGFSAAQCGVATQAAACHAASLGCITQITCGIACTAIGPCASIQPTCAHFCTHFGPCPTVVTCHPAACSLAGPCMSVYQHCVTPFGPCLTPVCTIGPVCTTAICHFETPACPQDTLACPQQTPACPQPTLACPGPSIGCGFGMQGAAFQARAALPTMYAYCTQVCSQMACGGGAGGMPR